MIIADLDKIEGRRYPARRRTQNVVGGASAHPSQIFLNRQRHPRSQRRTGAWHNQQQEEVYFVLEGTGEILPGRRAPGRHGRSSRLHPARRVPPTHNIGDTPLRMIYCYGPAGDVAPLETGTKRHAAGGRRRCSPASARRTPQCTEKSKS